jgi:hypothetical protein
MSSNESTTSAVPTGADAVKQPAWRPLFLVSIFLSAITASLLILKFNKFAPTPFFWLWLTWTAALWSAVSGVSRSWVRATLFNLGFVPSVLAGAEAYFVTHEGQSEQLPRGFLVADEALGWAPAKGVQARAYESGYAGLFHGPAGLVYDVKYTIDSNGLRKAPPWRADNSAGTVLFFGCSFTFGTGLEDNETLPYQLGAQSGGRYRSFNFGFGGYCPAQMLAAIESGMVQRVVTTAPQYAFYVAIPHHVWRVAGRAFLGERTPRYVLEADETLHRAGKFADPKHRVGLPGRVEGQFNKSALWRRISRIAARITDDDLRLYFAVVRRAQQLIASQYPKIQFRVILWPGLDYTQASSTYDKLREGFHRMGIPVDLVEDILPGIIADRSPFALSPIDPHPNALANRLIAQYVLNKISQ